VRIEVTTQELELAAPLSTGHGVIERRQLTIVTVSDGDHVGRGEAAPLPGFGLESPAEAHAALRSWAEGGRQPSTPSARGAAACALHELELDRRGIARPSGPLHVQALVGAPEPDGVAEACRSATRRRHRAVKLKVGALSPSDDIDRVIAARSSLSPDVLLRLDANQAWDLSTAQQVLTALDGVAIDLVEEPTPNPADWTTLEEATGLAIAADESLTDIDRSHELISSGRARAVLLKPAVLGGPRQTIELAERASEAGVRMIVSSFIDGPIGLRCTRDVALLAAPDEIHGIGTAELFVEDLPLDVTPIGGALHTHPADLSLPPRVEHTRTTPEFTEETVPAGLLSAHEVAADNWAVVRVLDGALRFVWEGPAAALPARRMGPHATQVIPPSRPHRVEPEGRVRFRVEFHHEVG